MRKGICILVLIAAGIIFPMSVTQAEPIVLRLGNVLPLTDPASLACDRIVKQVWEKSNGRLKMDFFAASQLGNAITQIEGAMMGTQDMFQDAVEWMSQFEKDYSILALAYGFRDQKHLQAFFNSPLNTEIKEKLRKDRGVRILAFNWDRNPRVLLSKKPVYSPKDLQGVKMRVPEIELYLRVWKALGTQPTQVPAAEIYLALMQGVVDAMEGPLNAIYSLKLHESAKFISLTNHLLSASMVCINDKKFQGLPKDLQDILVEAAKDAGDYFTKVGIDSYDRDKKEMEAKGVKFIDVDRAPFMEKVKTLAKELEDQGKWSKGLYQKIQDLK